MHICPHLNIISKPADRSQILKKFPSASFCSHPPNIIETQILQSVSECVKVCSERSLQALILLYELHVCRTCDYLASARLVLLMCAVRIAFIEDNINLTLNFHLIFGARTWGLSRHWLHQSMFSGHILPPSVVLRYYRLAAPVGEAAALREENISLYNIIIVFMNNGDSFKAVELGRTCLIRGCS